MSKKDKDYDTTVARIAGNILSGVAAKELVLGVPTGISIVIVQQAVKAARCVVSEVCKTEPKEKD